MIDFDGRGLNSQPGQSFSPCLCRPNSFTRGKAQIDFGVYGIALYRVINYSFRCQKSLFSKETVEPCEW